MKNLKLPATLTAAVPSISAAAILQTLEAQEATGTLALGALELRLRAGRVCWASGDALAVVASMLGETGLLAFRAVPGTPSGELSLSPTALLLEAARLSDELARAEVA